MNYIKLDAPVLMAMRELTHEEIARIMIGMSILIQNPTREKLLEITNPERTNGYKACERIFINMLFYYIIKEQNDDNGRA